MMSQAAQALWTRRFFLKTSFAGMMLLGSRLVFPDLAAANSLPEGQLHLYNVEYERTAFREVSESIWSIRPRGLE